ncbi:hypothetical protein [Falsiroseomonas selenitidurans]|uniref:MFS transporter n=1 Tax=Falsiroseomonas selenitidurans TaxID=2716335 RepID=A0ABX1E740_9PROT|nr:hypothetical protein [Falsiroseomonas selenitidurans]NKC33005.1 hypothetical protein [Falsiroseomonas selenitidurans]
MSPQTLFLVTMSASLLNGMVSPATGLVFGLWPLWYPQVVTPVQELIYYGASLIVATATLLSAAIPAAIAERLGAGPVATMGFWAGGAALLLLLGVA